MKPRESAVDWLVRQTEACLKLRAQREREEREYNAGARIADDHHCRVCGARGHVGLCPVCEAAR